MEEIFDVFSDYLAASEQFEILHSRLLGCYIAITQDGDAYTRLRSQEALAEYIASQILDDIIYSGDFPEEMDEDAVSERIVLAFRQAMQPYINRLPMLDDIVEFIIAKNTAV